MLNSLNLLWALFVKPEYFCLLWFLVQHYPFTNDFMHNILYIAVMKLCSGNNSGGNRNVPGQSIHDMDHLFQIQSSVQVLIAVT